MFTNKLNTREYNEQLAKINTPLTELEKSHWRKLAHEVVVNRSGIAEEIYGAVILRLFHEMDKGLHTKSDESVESAELRCVRCGLVSDQPELGTFKIDGVEGVGKISHQWTSKTIDTGPCHMDLCVPCVTTIMNEIAHHAMMRIAPDAKKAENNEPI